MNKQQKIIFLIISIICLLSIAVNIFFVVQEDGKTNAIYCVAEAAPNDKMELYFDYKDGHIYKYTIVSTNPMKEDFNKENYEKLIGEQMKKVKGYTAKLWYDDEKYIVTEVFQLEEMSKEELQGIGFSLEDLQNKSREEIIDSITAFNTDPPRCN